MPERPKVRACMWNEKRENQLSVRYGFSLGFYNDAPELLLGGVLTLRFRFVADSSVASENIMHMLALIWPSVSVRFALSRLSVRSPALFFFQKKGRKILSARTKNPF